MLLDFGRGQSMFLFTKEVHLEEENGAPTCYIGCWEYEKTPFL